VTSDEYHISLQVEGTECTVVCRNDCLWARRSDVD